MATVHPWPVGAPQFANTWTQQAQPVTIRSSMDIGQPKVRRRYTRAMYQYDVTMVGTREECNAVLEFFDLECQGGVNFHTFLNPFSGVVETYRFMESPSVDSLSALAGTIAMKWEKL